MQTTKILNKLSPAQEALLPVVRDEWVQRALGGDTSMDPQIRQRIEWVYSLAGLKPPTFLVVCDSPFGCQLAANLMVSLMVSLAKQAPASVWASVWDSVRDSVWDSVWDSVGDSVRDSVWDSVWDSVGDSVRDSVRDSVGDSVRDSVRDSVWDSVRDSVWDSVWDSVGDSVRDSVRDSVGDSVRDSVRDSVGDSVRASVGDSQIQWFEFNGYYGGLGWDSGWCAFYDYFRRIDILRHDKFNAYVELVQSGVWDTIMLAGCAIICRRPRVVCKDDRGRLHNTSGPAVEWADGYRNYVVHGVRLPDGAWVEDHSLLTARLILGEANAEVRRVMLSTMGHAAFISDAQPVVLDTDVDLAGQPRRLLRVGIGEDEPLVVCEVRCPSTGHEHILRVPPTSTRCSQAIAWTFGMELADYAPIIER